MPPDIPHLSCSSSPSPSAILSEAPSMARECRQRPAPATAPQTRDQPRGPLRLLPPSIPGNIPGTRHCRALGPTPWPTPAPAHAASPSPCDCTPPALEPPLWAHENVHGSHPHVRPPTSAPSLHPPSEGRARGPALAQAARQGSSFPDTVSFSSSKSGFLTNIHTRCDFPHFRGSEPHTPRYSHHPIPLHRVTMSSSGDDSPPTILSTVLSRTHRSTP